MRKIMLYQVKDSSDLFGESGTVKGIGRWKPEPVEG